MTTNTSTDGSPTRRHDDEGTVLILTLLLTIVLAVIVLALATYAAAGLATSKVTTNRTESNAVATNGLTWAIEEFSKKTLVPEDDTHCNVGPVVLSPPAGMIDGGSSVSITCTRQPDIDDHPTVLLEADATLASGTNRTIEVVLQVPASQRTTQIHSWVAD